MPTAVPLWLIDGPADARQAAWLMQQLATRPAAATWAVLTGQVETAPAAAPGLHIETLGGCPCCSGAAALRVALVRLLRRVRPQKIWVLPAGAAHADPAAALQRDPWLSPALAITRLTLILPATVRDLPEDRLRDRLRHADRVLLLTDPHVAPSEVAAAARRITALGGPLPETAPAG